jgi:competence protein ComEA
MNGLPGKPRPFSFWRWSLTPGRMKTLSLRQQLVLFPLALLLLFFFGLRLYHSRRASPPEQVYAEIVVEVIGEVRTPGIQIFPEVPSLRQALEKAGALDVRAEENDTLRERLESGTLITVSRTPSRDVRVTLARMEARKLVVFSIPLDLNQASIQDLCLIPGIGEGTAREIIAYRAKRRAFRSIDELKQVKGIGEKKFESWKNHLTVRQTDR